MQVEGRLPDLITQSPMPWSFLIVLLYLCFCAFCGHSRQRSRCHILQTPLLKINIFHNGSSDPVRNAG